MSSAVICHDTLPWLISFSLGVKCAAFTAAAICNEQRIRLSRYLQGIDHAVTNQRKSFARLTERSILHLLQAPAGQRSTPDTIHGRAVAVCSVSSAARRKTSAQCDRRIILPLDHRQISFLVLSSSYLRRVHIRYSCMKRCTEFGEVLARRRNTLSVRRLRPVGNH